MEQSSWCLLGYFENCAITILSQCLSFLINSQIQSRSIITPPPLTLARLSIITRTRMLSAPNQGIGSCGGSGSCAEHSSCGYDKGGDHDRHDLCVCTSLCCSYVSSLLIVVRCWRVLGEWLLCLLIVGFQCYAYQTPCYDIITVYAYHTLYVIRIITTNTA